MNEKHLIKLPGTIDKVTTLSDGSIKFSVITQELGAEASAGLFKVHRQLGWFVFSPEGLTAEDIPTESIDDSIAVNKTPSRRLRAVLYRLWEQSSKTLEFEEFYRLTMEKVINNLKDKLN